MEKRKYSFFKAGSLISKLLQLDKKLAQCSKTDAEIESNVKSYTASVVNDLIKERIQQTPIEELSRAKSGIRVKALKDAGYTNISQLQGMKVDRLQAIPGIGDKSATGIKIAVDQLVRDISETTRLRIDPDRQTGNNDKLVQYLYEAQLDNQASANAKSIYDLTHDNIDKLVKMARTAANPIRWLFANDEKKEAAMNSLDGVIAMLDGSYKDNAEAVFREKANAKKVKHDEYWGAFNSNSAGFYAALENIQTGNTSSGSKLRKKDRATQSKFSYGALPIDLANEVEKINVNLSGLKCSLRKYQLFGVKYIVRQGTVLLGDEMGLGKTVQAIGTMVSLRNAGKKHFVVVCPASVLINWCREIAKHSDLDVVKVHGQYAPTILDDWKQSGGVVVTTYETLGKLSFDTSVTISLLVVDEAHYIKNPSAARTQNVYRLRQHAERVLFMSGTSLENNVKEMVFLVGMLNPAIARELESHMTLAEAAQFRRVVAPVYFRRTQEDVLTEMPEKEEKEQWCELNTQEADKYRESVLARDFMSMRQVSWKLDDVALSSKASRMAEICEESIDNGRKVIVFSFFINTIDNAKKSLNVPVFGPITGSISPDARQKIIDDFTEYEGGAVLLSQIQAGGTGLNIQAASVIILCEPQLKPSIENQAIARAYRMGQNRNVIVHRLLCEHTVDEMVMDVLRHKQELFDKFADKSLSGQESLGVSETEFNNIIDHEYKRVTGDGST